jgi:hypothetical protein
MKYDIINGVFETGKKEDIEVCDEIDGGFDEEDEDIIFADMVKEPRGKYSITDMCGKTSYFSTLEALRSFKEKNKIY